MSDPLVRKEEAEPPLRYASRALDALLDDIPSVILIKGAADLRLRRANRAAHAFLGERIGTAIGLTAKHWLPPSIAAAHEQVEREALIRQQAVRVAEPDFPLPDGRVVTLSTEVVPVFTRSGKPVLVARVSTDITAEREAAAKLHRNQVLRDHSERMALTGTWEWDLASGMVWRSDQQSRNLGQVPSDGPQFDWVFAENIHPDDLPAVKRHLHGLLKSGETTMFECRVVLPGAVTTRYLRVNCEAILGADGRVTKVYGATQDITGFREAERNLQHQAEHLQRQSEELARSNRALDEFAHAASHDLKEPLRGIHTYATFLKQDYADQLDDRGRTMLDAMGGLSLKLEALIDSLLAASQVGRDELRLRSCALERIVWDALESLQVQLAGATVSVEPDLPKLYCDPDRVVELYRNLLSNALKYNDKQDRRIRIGQAGGPHGCVPAAAPYEVQNHPLLYVSDNGIGVPPQHHQRIFQMFKRLHAKDVYGGGSGVGLALVDKIVRRHGGWIWIESVPEHGSTFWFSLGSGNAPVTQLSKTS